MLNQHRSMPQPDGPSPFGEGVLDSFGLAHPDAEAYLAIPEVIQHPPQAASQRSQAWRWLLLASLSCVATSAAAVGAFLWLINLPPTTDCDNAATVTTDRAQLYCAQLSADSGDIDDVLTSLALVATWPEGHSLHHEVHPLVEEWSWVVLNAAEQELRNGRMDEAKALIGHIPTHSPVYEASQAFLNGWNTEWDEGSALVAKADAALQQKDWGAASAQIQALGQLQNPHWRVDQVQTLAEKIRQERRANDLLTKAVALASPGGGDQLGAAIRTASQIQADTFTHAAAQTYLDRWSDLLLQEGLKQWYASNFDQAITMGRYVAVNPQRAKAAQELIWLSQARQMAQQSLGTWRTSPDQLITLYKAMLLANRVPADSPFHPQAQSSVATWRTHLDDLGKLQTAQLAGRIYQRDTLKLAINQAEKVPLGHPRRVQAQTMIAHWRQEIERIEDRPSLTKAHDLAKDKTLESLRAAITTANTIAINRALRGEAQSWIYVWQNQIETIEDQPILDRARSLAEKGQLFQAIAEASGVKAGRALYDEAQASIDAWQGQIAAQERARQRAAQPTLGRTQVPQTGDLRESQSSDTATSVAPRAVPPTAAPIPATVEATPVPHRSTPRLPDRIETVPGDAPTVNPTPAPVEAPAPLGILPSPKPAPTAPAPILTAPPPLTQTPVAPTPVEPPSPPTPVAPPPVLEAPPPASEGATPEDDRQGARSEVAPTVSVRPRPEFGMIAVSTIDTGVLYTGALYLG